MERTNECALCSQVAGRKQGDLLAQLLDAGEKYMRRVGPESQGFAVIPSVGPLTVGHVLLCPKFHYTSFARVPRDLWPEYRAMKAELTDLLETAFSRAVHIFEHGTDARCSRVICSVEHAHQHFVPADVDVWDRLHGGIDWVEIPSGIDHLERAVREGEYLLYEAPGRHPIVAVARESRFESQHIRRVFAEALGVPEKWNWRQYPLPEDIEATFKAISAALKKEAVPIDVSS